MRPIGMGIEAVAAVVLAASPAVVAPAWAWGGPAIGKPAPGFTVKTFDGRTIALKDLKGQVVVLNFWAAWCAPSLRA